MRTLNAAWISPRCFRDITARTDRGAAELQDRCELVRLQPGGQPNPYAEDRKEAWGLGRRRPRPQAFRIRTTRGGPGHCRPTPVLPPAVERKVR